MKINLIHPLNLFWSFSSSSHCAGVCVIICNSLLNTSKFQTDYDGRLLYIDIDFDNKCFRLINIDAPVVSHERHFNLIW